MHDLFLWMFSGLALVGAVGTIASRHPINSAIHLVLTFLAVASIYVLLDAHLLAAIQVIVYVGAIMFGGPGIFIFLALYIGLRYTLRGFFGIAML